jgi:hypothetical protein
MTARLPAFVENRDECEKNAVIDANRAWMGARYLNGELKGQCKDLFYPDANYYYCDAVPLITGEAHGIYEHD